MSVGWGRGVYRVQVSLDQSYTPAARAGGGSKGGRRVEVLKKHCDSCWRSSRSNALTCRDGYG